VESLSDGPTASGLRRQRTGDKRCKRARNRSCSRGANERDLLLQLGAAKSSCRLTAPIDSPATARQTRPMSDVVPPEYLEDPKRYFLEWLPQLLDATEGARRHFGRLDAVAQFHLTGDRGGWWYIHLGRETVWIDGGRHPSPSFTLTMPVDTWRQVHCGQVSGTRAYLRGDIKFAGSRWKFLRVLGLFGAG
jgi:putative sterol carrier protein